LFEKGQVQRQPPGPPLRREPRSRRFDDIVLTRRMFRCVGCARVCASLIDFACRLFALSKLSDQPAVDSECLLHSRVFFISGPLLLFLGGQYLALKCPFCLQDAGRLDSEMKIPYTHLALRSCFRQSSLTRGKQSEGHLRTLRVKTLVKTGRAHLERGGR
jgi:hypothetical protein